MIKSKLEARERALELAVKTFETWNSFSANLFMDWAKMFEQYLIGDAELPEVFDDNGHLKELIEMAKKSMEDMNKRNDDLFDDIIKTLPKDAVRDKGLVGIVPCKSDAE